MAVNLLKLCGVALVGATMIVPIQGCNSFMPPGTFGVQERSFDRKGEIVEVELLDVAAYNKQLTDHNLTVRPEIGTQVQTSIDLGIGSIVGKIIDLGGKWIQGELEKEAERYRQQFSGSAFVDGYWTASRSVLGGMEPKYVAVRIRRYTDAYPKLATSTSGPAFEFLAALKLSGDRNFVVMYPIYMRTNSAKAKFFGSKFMTELQFEQTGYWLDSGGVLKTTTLANPSKSLTSTISEQMTWNLVDAQGAATGNLVMWGALAAPPISANAAKGRDTGILHITATITETDQTKAADYFKKAAKFVEEKTPEVSQAVRERVEKALDEVEKTDAPAVE